MCTFCLYLFCFDMISEMTHNMFGKFHFVDLAGSERAHKTGNVGDRFKGKLLAWLKECLCIIKHWGVNLGFHFRASVFSPYLKCAILNCKINLFFPNLKSYFPSVGQKTHVTIINFVAEIWLIELVARCNNHFILNISFDLFVMFRMKM